MFYRLNVKDDQARENEAASKMVAELMEQLFGGVESGSVNDNPETAYPNVGSTDEPVPEKLALFVGIYDFLVNEGLSKELAACNAADACRG